MPFHISAQSSYTEKAPHPQQAYPYSQNSQSEQPEYIQAEPQSEAGLNAERKAYADKVRQSYNFSVMKGNISLPGNATVQGGDFIQPGAFPNAQYCGHCHQEAYHQWRQALHSNSFRTPFYRASVNIVMNTKGIQFARHCDSCHNPIAVLSGGLTQESIVDRKFDQDGLTCATCHSIQKVQSTIGNGGYVMGVPAVMTDVDGKRIPGEVPYADILAHPDRHAKAVMQPLYRTPEFCAACHKANLPTPLNGYKWIRAFTTYDEWQNSKFSQRNPLTFYSADFTTCQGCHMKRAANTLPEPGAKNGTFVSHRWEAGNTAVPFYYGFDEQLQKTIAFLRSGNYLNVDLFALQIAGQDEMIAPLGTKPFTLKPSDVVQALVVIQNKNIGHSLIPEVRDLYEAWVEFTVKDSAGKDIYHSGFIKPDGMLDERAHSFTNRPVNSEGTFVDNHKVWTIHSVAYDNTVAAGRSALVRYEFKIPADIKDAITITARVNYRHLRQSYINNVLGKDHPDYPIIELASRSRVLKIGENEITPPDAGDNPDWMRWNNLGIGYLDQLQYPDAIHAFQEVVKLRPDYADGYTNLGLTNIEWEKFTDARTVLDKALALNPDSVRALYYSALIERRLSHSEVEIADLKKVVEMYPQSRDARRELGISYYQQDQPKLAMEQFEELQKIDPDDLAAHYNLAILYRRAGMKDKARRESAMFVTKKVDPGAPTYSLDFLRKHPEISTESVPWHIHSDLSNEEVRSGGQY
ncbi:tetratricopeptide repeat protein [Acidicapsa ligni]|uniref:tetratricopeptide repeat protein n=1 Tax=Acidicapsa ligni TaxID=542300 RepID=UPI0021DF5867|nr:tetratricopeptide repeat protein [Acidicapsa ligni]